MIKIIEKKNKKVKPHYVLTYDYMIGDANGDTREKCIVSIKNPYLERYVTLMNSLKPTKGTWGIVLKGDILENVLSEEQITKDDYHFLNTFMYEDSNEGTFFIEPENEKYRYEFSEGVRGEAQYSFLVFQGISLKYVDENNIKYDVEIIPDNVVS